MPNPLAVAESLLIDVAFQALFFGHCGRSFAIALVRDLQARTNFHGVGQRAKNGDGWKGILGRLAYCPGRGLAHLLEASRGRGRSSPHQVVVARRDEGGRAALLATSASEDGESGGAWELRGNAFPL